MSAIETIRDAIQRDVRWKVQKWEIDRPYPSGLSPTERKRLGYAPDETVEFEGNLALNAGLAILADKLIGAGSATVYSNANAYLKVGNGTAAAAATQTDLQGGTTAEKAMDATYPIRTGQTIRWDATFQSAEGNFAWEEFGVKNGAGAVSGTIVLFNRKVQALGTKASGSVWTLTLEITFS